jgi:hypothetical protein
MVYTFVATSNKGNSQCATKLMIEREGDRKAALPRRNERKTAAAHVLMA